MTRQMIPADIVQWPPQSGHYRWCTGSWKASVRGWDKAQLGETEPRALAMELLIYTNENPLYLLMHLFDLFDLLDLLDGAHKNLK